MRVLLVEGEEAVRHGLAMRLGCAGVDVAAAVEDARAAVAVADAVAPDVVVVSGELPGAEALVRTLAARAAVVVLALDPDAVQRQTLRAAGAVAVVGKTEPDHVLLGLLADPEAVAR